MAAATLSVFVLLCVRANFQYSPTYDELKFLRVGQELASGQGWRTEMSVVHAPLSFYTHGFLLKPWEFSGERQRLRWARVTMLIYPVTLGALVFLWAERLFTPWGGALALAMFCFNSNVLAHSSLITTDMVYACFSMFLLYFFWRFLVEGRKRWVVAAGVSFGLALLSKYSAVLWFPLLPVLGVVALAVEARKKPGEMVPVRAPGLLVGLLAIFLLALVVLNAGYGFSGSFVPLGANHYQSDFLGWLAESPLGGRIPVPAPYPFMRGYDAQKYISEVGHPSFLAGMHSTTGWWYYYPVCFLLKMPVAFWPIMVWALVVMVRTGDRERRVAGLILIVASVAIVAASSLMSKSHAGFRYVLAVLPPLFVLCGAVAARATTRRKKAALSVLTGLYVLPSLWIHPHHLAYFSSIAGGPKNGYKWLSDSNLDWGQDFEHARSYARNSRVPVTVNPGMLPVPGRILINATTLQDCFVTYDIHGWLEPFEPVDYVGYSWLVFDVDEEALADRKPAAKPLPDEYYLGAFAYEEDRLPEAERRAGAALSSKPGLPEAYYLLGLAQLGLGELDEAARSFEAVPASHPFYVDARAELAFIAALQGRQERSRAYRKQSMREETLRSYATRPDLDKYVEARDSSDWKNLNNGGGALWAEGELGEAERRMRRAHEVQPDFIEVLSNLAVVLEERGKCAEAFEVFDKYRSDFLLLRASPYRDYRVYYEGHRVMLGDTLEIFPKPDEDVLLLKAHLARSPDDAGALNRLSIALMRGGRFGEAYRSLRRAIALEPENSALYTNLAVVYTEKKMFRRALDSCAKAIELDPENASAHELRDSIRKRLVNSRRGSVAGGNT